MKISQCDKILDYIKREGAITPLEAMAELGCMRLAARVADLKKRGHPIVKRTVVRQNRYGEPVKIAQYELEEVSDDG